MKLTRKPSGRLIDWKRRWRVWYSGTSLARQYSSQPRMGRGYRCVSQGLPKARTPHSSNTARATATVRCMYASKK